MAYTSSMKVPYVKMHGCHNDYIYIDNREGQFEALLQVDLSELARKVSDRKTGLGSDGLILLEKSSQGSEAVAKMHMLNADGSVGKMCGNGIRCVAKLLYESLGARKSYLVETDSGPRECFVTDAKDPKRFLVKVNMGKPEFNPRKIPVVLDGKQVIDKNFSVSGKDFLMTCVSMGNPHCVIEVKDLDKFEVVRYGAEIEKQSIFPEGINIEFIELIEGRVFQRTWERGSGETLACGTGACAVGVSLITRKKAKSPVKINLTGGTLIIEWDGQNEVWMTGEAVTESSGTLDLSNYF